MIRSFYHYLPRNYFNNLYSHVAEKLKKSENVCVSVMYGCGSKTFLNFFLIVAKKDRLFRQILYFDPEVEKLNLVNFVRKNLSSNSPKKLVVVRLFETMADKSEILEKLNGFKIKFCGNPIFLFITDHTAIIRPEEYCAKTTAFFSDRLEIAPFDLKQTRQMIRVTAKYFGWQIRPADYEKIYRLSGGIPRLAKYICKDIDEKNARSDSLEKFIKNASINFELNYLNKILLQLTKDELRTLGLVNNRGKIKSLLLERYFRNYQTRLAAELYPDLSSLEAKVFAYLYENKNRLVSLEKVADLMAMSDTNYSLWAIYKLLSRLNQKIKDHYKIENRKGRGYFLKEVSNP